MIRCLKIFYLLFFLPNLLLAQQGFTIQNTRQKTTIDFKWINNLIIIPVEMNGVKLNFVLDTGVDGTVLFSLEDAENIEFKDLAKIKIWGIGNKEAIEAFCSTDNEVRIGDYVDLNHKIYLVLDQDINISTSIGIPIHGILGYDFFKNYTVRINYVNHTIKIAKAAQKLHRRKEKFQEIPLTLIQNKPYMNINVQFETTQETAFQLLDTGNTDPAWFIHESYPNVRCIPESSIVDYLGKGMSGEIYGKRGRLPSMTIGDFKINRPIVSFPDSTYVRMLLGIEKRNGSLGNETLKRFHMIWDYPNQRVYLRPNSLFDTPFQYNMSGIEIQHQGMQWVAEEYDEDARKSVNPQYQFNSGGQRVSSNIKVHFDLKPIYFVMNVRKDSPAEIQGVKIGDQLLKIEGKDCKNMSLDQINGYFKMQDGKSIDLELERSGKPYRVTLVLKDLLP
ncbi:aspartyl protease family protein [Flavobacterium stagni]|uniref:PDZ domain-containing protein n=1 Tax=Flavobacterium stagni TaxID=2506421 RepID=A0A4Q1K6T2_9FLAO|nr:aspartyl protease family protein [Flavobacterium stagni]RXR21540.1 PDZ domain-containing protein [Flavobacterium stagni]